MRLRAFSSCASTKLSYWAPAVCFAGPVAVAMTVSSALVLVGVTDFCSLYFDGAGAQPVCRRRGAESLPSRLNPYSLPPRQHFRGRRGFLPSIERNLLNKDCFS